MSDNLLSFSRDVQWRCVQDIESYNTRLFKCKEEGDGGKVCYELRLASAVTSGEECVAVESLFKVHCGVVLYIMISPAL